MKKDCPQCGVKGSVDDSYIGRKIRCPKCREEFICLADEVVLAGGAEQESLPSHGGESAAPALVDESSAAESLTPEVEETVALLADEEQADQMDDSPLTVPQVHDEPAEPMVVEDIVEESVEEIEGVDEQAAEPVPEAALTPDLREEEESPSPVLESAVMEPLPQVAPAAADAAQNIQGTEQPPPASGRFSQGVNPRTDFTIGEALNEAWRYTKGAKGAIWAAVGMMYLVMLVLGFGLGFMQGVFGLDPASAAGIWAEIGVQTLISAFSTLFTAGLMYIGVRRAAEKSYSWKMVFAGFQMAMKLLIAGILMTLLVISGLVLLVLPGIYLAVGYTMTLPLMLDRQLEPWQAMEISRKAIHRVWWKIFGLFFVMGLLYLVSAIPLGIGLIWTIPMFVILGGVVYRYLFGIQAK